ncbi:hypothetical protein [Pedobacter sp. UYP1]|uniref:hypothetical protein n=1 Tax=Pedobacter sp. UYP1 TaxID=1756396 RepID=UPI003397E8F8
MYHITTTNSGQYEQTSRIGGVAHINQADYPVCPVTQKPMLLLMSLKKDLFDSGFAVNNLLEDSNYCISIFLAVKIHPEFGIGTNMPALYTVNDPLQSEKIKNGTVKVILHYDTGKAVELAAMPPPIPERKIVLTKFSAQETKDDFPAGQEWFEGSKLTTSKFGAQFPAWLQEPINIDPEIMTNFAPVFRGFFGPEFILQLEDKLISAISPIHSGLLGNDGIGYLYLPTSVRNFVKKYQQPVEIGNFFIQDT